MCWSRTNGDKLRSQPANLPPRHCLYIHRSAHLTPMLALTGRRGVCGRHDQAQFKTRTSGGISRGIYQWLERSGESRLQLCIQQRRNCAQPLIGSSPFSSNNAGFLPAPRIGIAWAPFSKTVIRAGFGTYYALLDALSYRLDQNPTFQYGIRHQEQIARERHCRRPVICAGRRQLPSDATYLSERRSSPTLRHPPWNLTVENRAADRTLHIFGSGVCGVARLPRTAFARREHSDSDDLPHSTCPAGYPQDLLRSDVHSGESGRLAPAAAQHLRQRASQFSARARACGNGCLRSKEILVHRAIQSPAPRGTIQHFQSHQFQQIPIRWCSRRRPPCCRRQRRASLRPLPPVRGKYSSG